MGTDSTVAEEMRKLVQYLQSLPPQTNPYFAARDYLIKDTTLPAFSPWAVISLRLILTAHIVLSLQSLVLIYLRLVVKRSKCMARTRQGLLRPDMPSATAITNFCYGVLAVVDLSMIEIMNRTRIYISSRFLLCGVKYLFLFAYAWSYIWVCLCTCASLLWDDRWSTQDALRGKKTHMPTPLKIFLNGLFLTLIILPWPPVFWAFGSANDKMLRLQQSFRVLEDSLNTAGAQYNHTGYTADIFDPLLVQMTEVLDHQLSISSYTIFGMSFFLGMILFLVVNRINAYEKALPASPPDSQTQLYAALQDLKQQHRALLKQALVTYFTSWVYIPILAWERNRFLEERTRWVVIPLLLHGVWGFTGNIILGLLAFQTLKNLKKQNKSMPPRSQHSQTLADPSPPYRLRSFIKLSLDPLYEKGLQGLNT